MAVTTAEMLLPAADSFDLRATVLSHGYYELAPCVWTPAPRPTLERVERLEGRGVYLVRLRMARTGAGVVMRATGPDGDQVEALAPLAVRMRRVLRLDETFADFRLLCQRDPALRPIVRLGLCRMLRGATLFEDVVKTIAASNTNWAGALQTIGRLGNLGSPCAADRRRHAFPTPAQVVRLGEDELRRRTRLGYRADYIARLAREVSEGLRDLDRLDAAAATMPLDDLAAALGEIRGIGPVAAGWLLLLLGRYERPTPTVGAAGVAEHGVWQGLTLWFQQWLASEHPAVGTLRRIDD